MLMLGSEKHAILVALGWTPVGEHPWTVYRVPAGKAELPPYEAYKSSGHVARPTHAIEWRCQGEDDFKRLVIDGQPYEGTLGAMESAMAGSLNAPMYGTAVEGDEGAFEHPMFGWVTPSKPEYRIVRST